MTDPRRVSHIEAAVKFLPKGSTVIYRHFSDPGKVETAKNLRDICLQFGHQLLIGADPDLAVMIGADGVHFREVDIAQVKDFRAAHPNMLITGAAHSLEALKACAKVGMDAALLSPVFPSPSPSAGQVLGVETFSKWAKMAGLPVFALGGVNRDTAAKLVSGPCAGIAGISGFVRQACALEQPAVRFMAELHQDAFEHGWPASDFVDHINNPSDDVLGFWGESGLDSFIISRTQDDQSEILTIAVSKGRRGQGLGADMLGEAEMALLQRGAEIVFLEVAKDNAAAIGLYAKSGYVRCGVRPGYYRREKGRVDALLYQKHLE